MKEIEVTFFGDYFKSAINYLKLKMATFLVQAADCKLVKKRKPVWGFHDQKYKRTNLLIQKYKKHGEMRIEEIFAIRFNEGRREIRPWTNQTIFWRAQVVWKILSEPLGSYSETLNFVPNLALFSQQLYVCYLLYQ